MSRAAANARMRYLSNVLISNRNRQNTLVWRQRRNAKSPKEALEEEALEKRSEKEVVIVLRHSLSLSLCFLTCQVYGGFFFSGCWLNAYGTHCASTSIVTITTVTHTPRERLGVVYRSIHWRQSLDHIGVALLSLDDDSDGSRVGARGRGLQLDLLFVILLPALFSAYGNSCRS